MCVDKKIRVAIVDDHPVVREGLRTFLQLADDIEIVYELESGEEAVRLLHNHEVLVDVVIMDLKMPGPCDGVEAIKELHERRPNLRLLALTSFQDSESALAAMAAGAIGYLHKDVSPDLLLGGIRQAAAGRMVMERMVWVAASESSCHHVDHETRTDVVRVMDSPEVHSKATNAEPLTHREREVLNELARGLSNKEIGHVLDISEKTVKIHVSHILSKLGVFDRTQAVLYAVKIGLVEF